MSRRFGVVVLCVWLCVGTPGSRASAQVAENQIVESAAAVVQEIMATPASQIPESLLRDAQAS